MVMSRMRLVLPLPENLGNARIHWREKLRRKKAYWDHLNTLKNLGRIPGPPLEPFDPARIAVHWHVWNRMDRSNAMARMKWVEDWLSGWGYIVDDNEDHLRYEWPPEQTVERKNPRLVLELCTDGEGR